MTHRILCVLAASSALTFAAAFADQLPSPPVIFVPAPASVPADIQAQAGSAMSQVVKVRDDYAAAAQSLRALLADAQAKLQAFQDAETRSTAAQVAAVQKQFAEKAAALEQQNAQREQEIAALKQQVEQASLGTAKQLQENSASAAAMRSALAVTVSNGAAAANAFQDKTTKDLAALTAAEHQRDQDIADLRTKVEQADAEVKAGKEATAAAMQSRPEQDQALLAAYDAKIAALQDLVTQQAAAAAVKQQAVVDLTTRLDQVTASLKTQQDAASGQDTKGALAADGAKLTALEAKLGQQSTTLTAAQDQIAALKAQLAQQGAGTPAISAAQSKQQAAIDAMSERLDQVAAAANQQAQAGKTDVPVLARGLQQSVERLGAENAALKQQLDDLSHAVAMQSKQPMLGVGDHLAQLESRLAAVEAVKSAPAAHAGADPRVDELNRKVADAEQSIEALNNKMEAGAANHPAALTGGDDQFQQQVRNVQAQQARMLDALSEKIDHLSTSDAGVALSTAAVAPIRSRSPSGSAAVTFDCAAMTPDNDQMWNLAVTKVYPGFHLVSIDPNASVAWVSQAGGSAIATPMPEIVRRAGCGA